MIVFRGTVDFYRQYRPGIPQSVAGILHGAVPRRTPRRLLENEFLIRVGRRARV